MFGFWLDLPSWVRLCISLPVLIVGIWMAVAGVRDRPKFTEHKHPSGQTYVEHDGEKNPGSESAIWLGIFVTGCGLVLVTTSGKSDSEKRGYNF
jgi:hypothetical protein